MVEFNPQVPNVNPTNFLGWSRAIPGFQGSKAGETLLKGIGSDIDAVAHDLNTAVKEKISDDVDTGITSIRDNYRNRLQATYNDISGQPLDILPQDSKDAGVPPPDLSQRISNRLDTLEAARKSGKYSDTHLDMEYDTFLKGIRDKYKGYKDWIDETAARSLGRGVPANRQIAQLTGDINSYSAQAQSRRNAVDTRLGQAAANGDPEAVATYQNRNNLSEAEKTAVINRKDVQAARVARIKQTRDQANVDQGLRTSAAYAEANQRVSDALSNFVHTFTMGNTSTERLISEIENPQTSPEQKEANMNSLSTYMSIFRQRQIAEFNRVDPKTGRSLDQDLGGKSGEIIDKQMAFYSSFKKWMSDGDGGPLAATVNYVKAMDVDPISSLMKGSIDQYVSTINKIMKDNPNGNAYLRDIQLDNSNINPSIKAAADFRRFSIASGVPTSINQVIEDSKNDNLSDKVGDANARSYYNNVVNWYQDLFKKDNPAIQRNMAKAMFQGGASYDTLRQFPPDTATSPGLTTVFNRWFSPAVDKVMFSDIGKKDPSLLLDYVNTKKAEFKSHVLPAELRALNADAAAGKMKWAYDNESHQLVAIRTDSTTSSEFAAANRLNISFASIKSMAKYTHEDPNALIAEWLADPNLPEGPVTDALKVAVKSSFLSTDEGDNSGKKKKSKGN